MNNLQGLDSDWPWSSSDARRLPKERGKGPKVMTMPADSVFPLSPTALRDKVHAAEWANFSGLPHEFVLWHEKRLQFVLTTNTHDAHPFIRGT